MRKNKTWLSRVSCFATGSLRDNYLLSKLQIERDINGYLDTKRWIHVKLVREKNIINILKSISNINTGEVIK